MMDGKAVSSAASEHEQSFYFVLQFVATVATVQYIAGQDGMTDIVVNNPSSQPVEVSRELQ
jgi:hypothetical protein